MNKKDIIDALAFVKANAKKRNFSQKIDLIVNFRDLNLKDVDQQVDLFVNLPFAKGKQTRICAFVGPELAEQAKSVVDVVVLHDQFPLYAREPKKVKKLAEDCNFFIAQANIMPDVAKVFGRVLGPRNKMPNPKAGCVVPPNANLVVLAQKLRTMVRVLVKTQLSFKTIVGDEKSKDDDVAENVLTILSALTQRLPLEDKNIKEVLLKLTMGVPVVVGALSKKDLGGVKP